MPFKKGRLGLQHKGSTQDATEILNACCSLPRLHQYGARRHLQYVFSGHKLPANKLHLIFKGAGLLLACIYGPCLFLTITTFLASDLDCNAATKSSSSKPSTSEPSPTQSPSKSSSKPYHFVGVGLAASYWCLSNNAYHSSLSHQGSF